MDSLVRAVTEDHAVRFVTVVTTSLSREACRRLEAKEMEARVLSRLCTTGCMLATIAKAGHARANALKDDPILGDAAPREAVFDRVKKALHGFIFD